MVRVVHAVSSRKRHKKILKKAKGARGQRSKIYRRASETVCRAQVYAYRDRRLEKRDFRRLWITRLSAACYACDINYSGLINGLKKANVDINRKMLSEIAIYDKAGFEHIVNIAKSA